MSYSEARRCPTCNTSYLNGTPHKCAVDSTDASRNRLELWLGDWVIEPTD